jgi:hypothetical protein
VRVAYFVTSYRPPAQLVRLLSTLRRAQPESPFVIHHDRFRTSWSPDLLAPLGDVFVHTSDAPLSWGDFSIVDATWTSLSWMLEHLVFDWIVTLSEQDYPIAPLAQLEHHLATCGADAIVQATPIDAIEDYALRIDCDRRYNYRYQQIPRVHAMGRLPPRIRRPIADAALYINYVLYRLQRWITIYRYPDPLPMRLGIRPRQSPFSRAFPCWYGSQWMALDRRAAESVVDFVRVNRRYVDHYAHTAIPDESATATIIRNDPTLRVADEDLHWIRFSSAAGHPDVLTIEDLPELVSSDHFFARKFDIGTDESVLDALDEHLFGPTS